jgi:hypothetical protein
LVNQTKPNLTNEISKEISTTACAVDELVLPVGRLGGGAAVLERGVALDGVKTLAKSPAAAPAAQSPAKPHQQAASGVHFSKLLNITQMRQNAAERHTERPILEERLLQRTRIPFTAGEIFIQGDPPHKYLYRMLADLGMNSVPEPDSPLIETDAYKVFTESLPKIYKGFHSKPVKVRAVSDFVIHCIAFLRAKQHPDFYLPEAMQRFFNVVSGEVKRAGSEGRTIPKWTPALHILGSIFTEECYGWSSEQRHGAALWNEEKQFAAEHGFSPRRHLFVSYHNAVSVLKEENIPPVAKSPVAKPPGKLFAEGSVEASVERMKNYQDERQSQIRPRVMMQTKEETLTMLNKNAFFRAAVTKSGRAANIVPNGEAMIEYYGGKDKVPKTYIKVLEGINAGEYEIE